MRGKSVIRTVFYTLRWDALAMPSLGASFRAPQYAEAIRQALTPDENVQE